MIDAQITFDQFVITARKTNQKIRATATCQGDNCTTVWLLECPYFKENYKVIAIDLSKQ